MAENLDYERHTRSRYRDPAVARRYATRQSFLRSPPEWLVGQLEKRLVRRGLRRLGTSRTSKILDVPAGSGKLQALLTSVSDFYCAVDISPAMLAFGDAPVVVVADATQLPFRDASFDTVVCLRLLHRVPESVVDAIFPELTRTAREGVVVSYGSAARVPGLHRLMQVLTRRTGQENLGLRPADVAALARSIRAEVLDDRSISLGLSAERIAVLRAVSAKRSE